MSFKQKILDNGFTLDFGRVDNRKILELLESMVDEAPHPFIFRFKHKLVICFLFENVSMSFEVEYTRIVLKTFEPNDSYEFPWKFLASQYGLNTISTFSGTKASLYRALCADVERRKSL